MHKLLLVFVLSFVQQITAGTLTFKSIDFDDEGVPSKVKCAFRGSSAKDDLPPQVVFIDSRSIVYGRGGYRPEEVKRNGDNYEVELTIDLGNFQDLLGQFKKSDWSLMLSGDPFPKRIGGAGGTGGIDVIEILKIRDVTIGFVVFKEAEQAGADQPATAPASKSEGDDKPQTESKPAPQ